MIDNTNPLDDLLKRIHGTDTGMNVPAPAPTASPTYPSAAPAAPAVNTTPKPKTGLSEMLPILAALFAQHQGGLGGYMAGMNTAKKTRADEAYRQATVSRQDQELELARQRADAETARYNASVAREERVLAASRIKDIEDRVNRAFDNNPDLENQVNQMGAESFSLSIPGIGNMNLKQALDAIGAVQGADGKYTGLGKPTKDLITGVDKDGNPVRVADKAGEKVYQRPRVGPRPTKRAYTWKDDDPESETFGKSYRIVEDENGKEISRVPLSGGGAPAPTPAATGGSKYQAGQTVKLKDGSTVTIKKINADGTFDY